MSDMGSEEGMKAIKERQQSWSLVSATREATGPRCRHGLEGKARCPMGECWNPPGNVARWTIAGDHARLWEKFTDAGRERFLLAHVYGTLENARAWARSYAEWAGLEWEIGSEDDAWYGNDTVPVIYRLTAERVEVEN